jgi:hypothetical protein
MNPVTWQALRQVMPWLWFAEVLACAAVVVFEVGRRMFAGPVLLDVGIPEQPDAVGLSQRKYQLGWGVIMLAVGLIEALLPRLRLLGLIFVLQGILTVVRTTRRLQIRQAGILHQKLFRWEDIQEWRLRPKATTGWRSHYSSIRLKLVSTGQWTSSGGTVPEACREAVAELLAS